MRRPLEPPSWLAPDAASLFRRMAPADQREALAVVRTLRHWGYGDDDQLLLAALLHDVGKSLAPPQLRYRVAITLLESLCPRLLRILQRRRGVLGLLADHPRLGAQLAATLPADVRRLIAHHHWPPEDGRSAALQLADGLH